MKLILTIVSIIFLSGCKSGAPKLPTLEDNERCVVSVKFQKCRCHMYHISKENVGRVGESYDKPFEYCDGLIGFHSDSWINLITWIEEVFDEVDPKKKESPNVETPNEIYELEIR